MSASGDPGVEGEIVMIPGRNVIDDAMLSAAGGRVSYLGRAWTCACDAVTKRPEILFRLRISQVLQQAAERGDWKEFWRGIIADPASAVALAVYATAGVVRDGRVLLDRATGRLPLPYAYGRVGDTVDHIELPLDGGGVKRVDIAPEALTEYSPGDPVRVQECRGRRGSSLRIGKPLLAGARRGGLLEFTSAAEVAAVVRAQYRDHSFCGDWEKVDIGRIVRMWAPEIEPGRIGLFCHRETGQAILIFRGTRPFDPRDWITNIATTHGQLMNDYRGALAVADWAKDQFPGLLLAGHSKGGGVAQFVAARTGLRAVCFNSVGLPRKLIRSLGIDVEIARERASVDHFAIKHDWVSNLGGCFRTDGMSIAGPLASARSGQMMLCDSKAFHILDSPYSRWQSGSLHSIDTLIDVLETDPHVLVRPFDLAQQHRSSDRRVRRLDWAERSSRTADDQYAKRVKAPNHRSMERRLARAIAEAEMQKLRIPRVTVLPPVVLTANAVARGRITNPASETVGPIAY